VLDNDALDVLTIELELDVLQLQSSLVQYQVAIASICEVYVITHHSSGSD
jgi:hypothetical protein